MTSMDYQTPPLLFESEKDEVSLSILYKFIYDFIVISISNKDNCVVQILIFPMK